MATIAPAASTFTESSASNAIRSVDDLLLSADPGRFVDQAYLTLLQRPADPSGGDYYRARIASGYGRPFVLAALRASDEAWALRAPPLPGFGLTPLVYILWRYGRGGYVDEPARWINLAYDAWRQLRLVLNGRLAAHQAREHQHLHARLDALVARVRELEQGGATPRDGRASGWEGHLDSAWSCSP